MWKMFKRSQSQSKAEIKPPQVKVKYPKRTMVYNVETNEYFMVLEKTKRRFISERAFRTWCFGPVLGSTTSLSGYPLGGKLGFRPGTLIKSMSGTPYMVSEENEIREIQTPDLYEVAGFAEPTIYASQEELDFYKKGVPISGCL